VNATFIGCSRANQTAVYTGGVRLGLNDGVVLSTGHVSDLSGGIRVREMTVKCELAGMKRSPVSIL
jgi:hypothetical protein